VKVLGSKRALWVGASLVLMVIGAVGPWAKVLNLITINGTDGGRDGWIIVGAAAFAAILLLVYAWRRRRWLLVFPVLAGLAGAATAAYDIVDIGRRFSASNGGGELVSVGWGIYVALIGSISLVAAGVALGFRPSVSARSRETVA
jgi:hypothetical protein